MLEFFRNIPKRYVVSVCSLILAVSLAVHDYLTYLTPTYIDGNTAEADEQDAGSASFPEFSSIEDEQDSGLLPADKKAPVQKPNLTLQTKVVEEDEGDKEKLLVVGKGDTLKSMLVTAGASKSHAQVAVDAIKKVYDPKKLKIGQGIKITVRKDPISKEFIVTKMEWRSSPEQEIALWQEDGKFIAKKRVVELKRCVEGVAGKIKSSFYNAAVNQGVPSPLVKSAIQALSYEVNFQHEPKHGNNFAILYEVYKDKAGKIVKYGNLLYAAFAPGGQLKQIYRYEGPNGVSFYNHKGECVVRGFLRSPLDVTRLRITSGFGNRMHPLKNYTIFHKGIDFGAPHGTRVVAAGAGVVTKAQYWGDFGLYVSIKHGDYTTEYAHLSKIIPGIKVGAKVSQGQVIGHVGSTGSTTGPHLHYGLLFKGKHINPNSIKTMPSHKLAKKDLTQFVSFKKTIESKISSRPEKGEYVLAINDKIVS